ncbi:helix-turn-helix domain-containing protein [Rhodococcus sp. IEGM 1409]|uniref:TetR/AcrR family transcriptional regulator n=1 Tax=Rhodococcus sp. IEGM 1409 TaxID=3047082 RepID=UPI0024B68E92|nr:helix-turn-helix domain-containing protein [Rhodococcus sp. IEGM 1409]MDI9900016.1 helix-turn-helix domain-containing protein [Rhodococcus sp. IEGM 1409]
MSIGAAEPRTRRMSAPERRALVLAAATRAFAKGGYSGTSTDAVAKEAGVSQPYVVRMFGTKADLFHAVFTRALDEIVRTFNDKLDTVTIDPSNPQFWAELGSAYGELVLDRDLLLVMLHGFATSTDDVAAVSRTAMSGIYTLLRERTGCTPEQARSFIANGMLINNLLAMMAPEHAEEDPALGELWGSVFSDSAAITLTGDESLHETDTVS